MVLYNKVYNDNTKLYYSDLLVYSIDGELLQTVKDNSTYFDFDVNNEDGELIVSNLYIDGVCNNTTYFGAFSNCTAKLSYDLYTYDSTGRALSRSEILNPETGVFVSLAALICLISGSCFIWAIKGESKFKKLY